MRVKWIVGCVLGIGALIGVRYGIDYVKSVSDYVDAKDDSSRNPLFSDKFVLDVALEKAEAGDADAQLMVGQAYRANRDVAKDMEKAVYWLT